LIQLIDERLRRNPLHGICGALELCRTPGASHETTLDLLAAMQEGVDLMCTITNDLLDLEKLRCGKFVVRPTAVDVRVLIESVAAAARPACSGVLSVLLADGQRLRQVLTNGLSNACKHAANVTLRVTATPAGGAAAHPYSPPGGSVELCVLNDGTGLQGVDANR
jgi:signal transduction histidine kinase